MSVRLPNVVGLIARPRTKKLAQPALSGTFASKPPAIVKFASVHRVLLLQRTVRKLKVFLQ